MSGRRSSRERPRGPSRYDNDARRRQHHARGKSPEPYAPGNYGPPRELRELDARMSVQATFDSNNIPLGKRRDVGRNTDREPPVDRKRVASPPESRKRNDRRVDHHDYRPAGGDRRGRQESHEHPPASPPDWFEERRRKATGPLSSPSHPKSPQPQPQQQRALSLKERLGTTRPGPASPPPPKRQRATSPRRQEADSQDWQRQADRGRRTEQPNQRGRYEDERDHRHSHGQVSGQAYTRGPAYAHGHARHHGGYNNRQYPRSPETYKNKTAKSDGYRQRQYSPDSQRHRHYSPDNRRYRQSSPERHRSRQLTPAPPSPPRPPSPIDRHLLLGNFVSGSIYERLGQVGEGTYGIVFKAQNVLTSEVVALKRIRMDKERDGFPITSMREIKILQKLRHPGVVRLLEMMIERKDVFMVFEYMAHDLSGLLGTTDLNFSPANVKDIAHQLLSALGYLHHNRVLHRDLKGSNILMDGNGVLKLADFGLARHFSPRAKTADYTNRVITLWYRPPELLLGATAYTDAIDIWSAGCILMEIVDRHPLLPGDNELRQLELTYGMFGVPTVETWPGVDQLPWFELLKSPVIKPTQPRHKRETMVPEHLPAFRHYFADKLSEQAYSFMCSILSMDPAKRPSANEALLHPYFTEELPKPERLVLDGVQEVHEWDHKERKREERRQQRVADEATAGASRPDTKHTTKAAAPVSKKAPVAVIEEENDDHTLLASA
ncbi:serine/threonine protein kinase, CMGC, CDC2/CDK sub [Savitreella phatthalungensis]